MGIPMLARPRAPDAERVELRGDVDREVADVLDAVWMARKEFRSRADLVEVILRQWADERIHESNMVQRVTRRDGSLADTGGNHGDARR